MAGASEGLGLAFARELACRGYSLVLFARRGDLLQTEASQLIAQHGVQVATQTLDLATPQLAEHLQDLTSDHPPSLSVYNAAYAAVGDFLDESIDHLNRVVDVNVRGPLLWTKVLGDAMHERGEGSMVLMSSLAGEQGSPRIATYAASKAFNTRLAEGLWAELQPAGINMLTCCAGAIATPGFAEATAGGADTAPGILSAQEIAQSTLNNLSRGPTIIPGWQNKLGALSLGRLLPRRWAIRTMARITRNLEAAG